LPKKIKDTEYLYASTRIRALERQLLNRERMDRMIEAKSDEEAFKVLQECGYGDLSARGADLEQALAAERRRVFQLLSSISPDKRLIEVFKIKYDYHNLKALIKAAAQNEGAEPLLVDTGRIPAKALADMYLQTSYGGMPPVMARVCAEATELLSRTGNPQLSDFILDNACLSEMIEEAEATGSAFLIGYVKMFIDAANIRSFVRVGRIRKSYDFLRLVLIPGGQIGTGRLFDLSLSGGPIEEVYAAGPFASAAVLAAAALRGETGLTAFEKAVEDAVIAYLKKARQTAFGEAPLAAYLAAKEQEITAVRTIMAGRRASLAPEDIREKLREAYV